MHDKQNDGLDTVARLWVLQDNGEWKRRVFIRDPNSGDGGGATEFHDVDNGRQVRLTVCLQRGTEGDFSFCNSAKGYA